ncbi:hypothetical protein SANTM175S_01417 [Streptomyces antimycoticus]
MVPVNATTYPAPSQPSVHAVADVLRGAHTAIRYRSWTQTEPAAGRGPVHALTAIGIGVAGWLYDPRTILSPGDERLYEAAITHLATHLGLDQPDDPDQFTAWHDAPGRTEADVLNALQATARVLEGYHPDRVFTPTARDVTSVHHGVALICYGRMPATSPSGTSRPRSWSRPARHATCTSRANPSPTAHGPRPLWSARSGTSGPCTGATSAGVTGSTSTPAAAPRVPCR